ncbi:MAG: MurR/RpiR family transcriptional regulator [Anaerolineae bacterium]|nr:MurR/RpiR family transcriptional regulator [Anaerolineae bacterium]
MTTAVRENILTAFDTLSPKQRKLARFILESEEVVAFASADELAERVGTSAATVVRFARSLGYDGYPALQGAVRADFPQFRTAAEKMEERVANGALRDGLRERVAQVSIDNVRQTVARTEPGEVERIVEVLCAAERIRIFAGGISSGAAVLAEYAFSMLGLSARAFTDAGMRPVLELSHLDERDVVIGISIWRYIRSTIQVARAAHKAGVTCIALTDNAVAPITRYANHVLVADTEGAAHGRSLGGIVALIDLLSAGIATRQPERSMAAIRRVDNMYRQHGLLTEE